MFEVFIDQAKILLDEVLIKSGVSAKAEFTIPQIEKFGDLSTNVCYQISSDIKKSSEEIADKFAGQIKPKGILKEVRAEKGYLNFFIDYQKFTRALFDKIDQDFGRGEGIWKNYC